MAARDKERFYRLKLHRFCRGEPTGYAFLIRTRKENTDGKRICSGGI